MFLQELFKRKVVEGGNLSIGGKQADHIDLQVHKRSYIVPILDNLLAQINATYQKSYKQPLWNPALLKSKKFLSGSSLHFFNTSGIPDDVFVQKKPKVGDLDTQVNIEQRDNIANWLQSIKGKSIAGAVFLGYEVGNEQFSSLWELQDPPIKVQIDLEFVEFEKDEPNQWAQFSHSSSWDDMQEGVKGVFHKWIIQSFTRLTTQEFLLRKSVGRGKAKELQDVPTRDNMFSFAVSSKEGGGLRQKYEPVINQETGQQEVKDGWPVYTARPTSGYDQNIGSMFATIFGKRIHADQIEKMMPQFSSFTGLLAVANQLLTSEDKEHIVSDFITKCYGKGAQGLYKNDPKRDMGEKDAAINLMMKTLKVKAPSDYEQIKADYQKNYRMTAAESFLREADEQPAVKAQLRKGMPHLHDLKAPDFLDLLDEIHDGNGKFKLQNIPLNVKVDGFGGRFGKNKDGEPFMGTSRTEPRYEASFVKYHQAKGTTDPEILGRAQMFDDLFKEMMNAIKLVDSKLGADFLTDKQVTCEVLFLPFATKTAEGRLKFVGIHYDELPKGVQLALVPFHVVEASTGEPIENDQQFINELLKVGQQGSVMFVNNRLVQKEGLDVTEIINVLDNIEELKQIVSDTHGKRDRASLALKKEVEEKLLPVKEKLEQAIISDPNIIGKDMLGKDYEGIVINSRLGPIKVTSQEQRNVIQAKQDAKTSARTERPRDNQNKTAVVAIGSFVGHKGHEELFNYTIKKAQEVGGDPYLFIGNAVGKDDPIPVDVKVQTWHKMYPKFAKQISSVQEGGSIMQKIKHELINPLPGKPPRYDNIIIMVGEDQANMPIANALMKAVNKFQGYEHVKVSLEVTPRGTGMSFTKLRNILKDPNATPEQQYQVWAQGFDEQKLGKDWILKLMDLTKQGMGAPKPVKMPAQKKPVQLPKQAAPAENMAGVGMQDSPERNATNEVKQRLDPSCWKGYKKSGTKMKGGKRVNNCVPVGEGWENEMAKAIALLERRK